MSALADIISENRRAKLAREMTHSGNFDNEATRAEKLSDILRAPGRLAQGAFTGMAGAPVDIANMAMTPLGLGSARRNSANLLAGGAAGAVGLNALSEMLLQPEYQQ